MATYLLSSYENIFGILGGRGHSLKTVVVNINMMAQSLDTLFVETNNLVFVSKKDERFAGL